MVTSAEEAAESYERVCKGFLDQAIQVKGMPTRVISGGGENQSNTVSSSGSRVSLKFDALLPSIRERLRWCVMNYSLQAELYLGQQISHFQVQLQRFLEQVPAGGTKDKAIKSQISEIKKELRPLAEWDRLFYIYKTMSFPSEIQYIFALEGDPIAAIWHYSQSDEQGEYRKTYNHKQRDGHVYAVRGNWAIRKGLMKARSPDGYIDDIDRPCQEIGCMCHLQWLYGIRRLPHDMVTEKGWSELRRVNAATQTGNHAQEPNIPAERETERKGLGSRLMRWFGRG